MAQFLSRQRAHIAWVALVFLLVSCATDTTSVPADEVETIEQVAPEDTPPVLTYSKPTDCTTLLPEADVARLAERGLELTAGPGSPNNAPIYPDGQTLEELVNGLSCLFSIPGEEDSSLTVLLGTAAMDQSIRPTVISDLVGQQLNIGQTPDGAITYWKWGDNTIVPALHNAIYEDAWYSALIQPGDRQAYDEGVVLVQAMRQHTTQ